MNQFNDTFDSVVYSASFSGVVAALELKEKGEKVLLINRYGFFGGTLTESLNLLQKSPVNFFQFGSISKSIFENLLNEKNSILFESPDHIIFNPEVIKFVLQKATVEKGIDLLFHIIPVNIKYDDEGIKLIVFGREGEIEIKTKNIYDFSNEFTIVSLVSPQSRKFIESRINFISLNLNDLNFEDENLIHAIKLNDNRCWISYKLNTTNLFEVENLAHEKFIYLDELLRSHGSRIQIVPPQACYQFEFIKQKGNDDRIKFIGDYLSSYQNYEEFLIAQKIEGMI